jgi:hypothetical protein
MMRKRKGKWVNLRVGGNGEKIRKRSSPFNIEWERGGDEK